MNQFQIDLMGHAVKFRFAAAQNDRMQENLVLVNQTGVRQLRDDTAAAEDDNVLTLLLLDLGDFPDQITFDECRVLHLT